VDAQKATLFAHPSCQTLGFTHHVIFRLTKIWKDPVWAAVISTAIVAAGGTVVTYLFGPWPTIGTWIKSVAAYGVATSQLPNWCIWLLGAVALPTVLFALALVWEALRGSNEPDPRLLYVEDVILGLRWRWKYLSGGTFGDVHSFCPHCDFQVFPQDARAYDAIDRIAYSCDSCGAKLAEFAESHGELESKVRRFIQQKLKCGQSSCARNRMPPKCGYMSQ
jgi:hypothetical protein